MTLPTASTNVNATGGNRTGVREFSIATSSRSGAGAGTSVLGRFQKAAFSASTSASVEGIRGSAVVTGGSSGIGLAVCEKFAAMGWTVHNVSRRPVDLQSGDSDWTNSVVNHAVDLDNVDALSDAAKQLATTLEQESGDSQRPISLVHCAGVHPGDSIQSLIHEGGAEEMARTLRVNVLAPALITSALCPVMEAGSGSSVVYVGSTLSEIGVPGRLSYVASKHALVGLMRATVQDLFGE